MKTIILNRVKDKLNKLRIFRGALKFHFNRKLLFIFRNRLFFSVVNQVILKSASSLLLSFLCIVGKKNPPGGWVFIYKDFGKLCLLSSARSNSHSNKA
jgi:hypothetical protein